MEELKKRRSETAARIIALREELKTAEEIIQGKACVYATGSFGRGEAGSNSDLDLFILGKKNGNPRQNDTEGSLLKRLDEICVKADLIEATRKLGIPEFDGDGRYLAHYSVDELTKTLGKPEDDVENTFTARLLLLLESSPLLGVAVYGEVIDEVIAPYWRDYEDHKAEFVPAYLANDILRLWRTFCVNYEARTERKPDQEKAKGKIKNYKLKHSRLLTCYSALLYLLTIYDRQRTVSPQDVKAMIAQTPTQRLEWLLEQSELKDAHESITKLLSQYDRFLRTTNVDGADLANQFLNRDSSVAHMKEASKFGDLMFEALDRLGKKNRFHRLLVV